MHLTFQLFMVSMIILLLTNFKLSPNILVDQLDALFLIFPGFNRFHPTAKELFKSDDVMKIMSSHKKEKIYEGYKLEFRAVMTLTLKPGIIFAPGFNICTKQTVKTCKNCVQFPCNNQLQLCSRPQPI